MPEQAPEQAQRFRATNGKVTGIVGLVACPVVAAAIVISEPAHAAVAGVIACAFAAVVVWLAMLRPSVSATDSELRLRSVFETVTVPMASIETVVVRRYLLVRSGGRRYICPAIGRSLRKTVRAEMKWRGSQQLFGASAIMDRLDDGSSGDAGDGRSTGRGKAPLGGGAALATGRDQELAYADFVEQRIAHLAAGDRARRGIEERSEEEYELGSHVVRRVAWPELALLAALAIAFVLALALP
ncbi:MAG TPA: hypothetical protein VHW64_17815 [Nocardioides sp.]|jgi:hypothetical protein|uniref:hypothetical protein n=1 Tax=Nocardioides sp. TaxID=35761 RepID=UPI002E316338|nr:hypothetical protein [Nocardioides sp.]HEX3932557.1 hypothetical protein [Nocardioides sp.]